MEKTTQTFRIQFIGYPPSWSPTSDSNFTFQLQDMGIETAIEVEDEEKTSEDQEMKKRKMVVYKFFLDSRERGMEDKTKQINRMLSVNSGSSPAAMTNRARWLGRQREHKLPILAEMVLVGESQFEEAESLASDSAEERKRCESRAISKCNWAENLKL